MKKLKTIIMSAAMLLGMGLLAAPQAAAAESSVFVTYELPFGLQFDEPIPKSAKFRFSSTDILINSIYKVRSKLYIRGKTVSANTTSDGNLHSLIFAAKPPKKMRILLTWGMSTESLKKVLRQQGAKDIMVIPNQPNKFSAGFITAVFDHYQYAFAVESYDGETHGLQAIEISEYLDGDY